MHYNNCCWLKKFWNEGEYEVKIFSVEGLEVSSGLANIKHLYNCCNKMYAVEISGTISNTSTPSVIVTYKRINYCNGSFKYTDSLGSLVCGKWVNKCGKSCNLIKGEDKLMGLNGSGKLLETKEEDSYSGKIYYNEMGKCNQKFSCTFTPLLK